MSDMKIDFQRRRALETITALGVGGAFISLLGPGQLNAMSRDDGYKALVCLFEGGGMDHNDTIMPFDVDQYNLLRSSRTELMDSYDAIGGTRSRARDTLLELTPVDAAATEGRRYAVPRELAPLREIFNDGDLSFVGSVGALVQPTNRNSYENRSVLLPPALFSHNDQANYWQGLKPEGAKAGWGGRFIDALQEQDMVGDPRFAMISTAGNALFTSANNVPNYSISNRGPGKLAIERMQDLAGAEYGAITNRIGRWLRTESFNTGNVLSDDFQSIQSATIASSDSFIDEFNSAPSLSTSFANSSLGKQLKNVAKSIQIAKAFGIKRQIFFVEARGFDTHSRQSMNLPRLQKEIAESVNSFRDAMVEIGMWNDVTLFSAADFGRTLIGNGAGTDHGWGSHHFVAGGSVAGGQMLGRFPQYNIQGDEYTRSRARLIPTVSIEQYSATLGTWLGVEPAAIDHVLPNLGNFNSRTLPLFNS